jgi:hypothetical protein
LASLSSARDFKKQYFGVPHFYKRLTPQKPGFLVKMRYVNSIVLKVDKAQLIPVEVIDVKQAAVSLMGLLNWIVPISISVCAGAVDHDWYCVGRRHYLPNPGLVRLKASAFIGQLVTQSTVKFCTWSDERINEVSTRERQRVGGRTSTQQLKTPPSVGKTEVKTQESQRDSPPKPSGQFGARPGILGNEPCWIRTGDPLIKSQMLCQLS